MLDVQLPTARDCMTTKVLSFAPEDEVFEVMGLLLKNHFAAAPVVDEDGHLTGMLTEKDCLRVLSNFAYDNDFEGGKAKDFESAIRVICEPDMDIFRVVEKFLATNFPLLPVVENNKLVGVISRRDTLRGIQQLRSRVDRNRKGFEQTAGTQADRPHSIESMQRSAASQSPEQLARIMGRRR